MYGAVLIEELRVRLHPDDLKASNALLNNGGPKAILEAQTMNFRVSCYPQKTLCRILSGQHRFPEHKSQFSHALCLFRFEVRLNFFGCALHSESEWHSLY